MDRIDLSTVPSAMEALARSWGANPTPPPRREPRVWARPVADARRPRPFPDIRDKGLPGFYGSEEAQARTDDARLAKADAMRAIARDMPDPRWYARYMPAEEAEALLAAERGPETWRFRADVPPALMAKMRSVGLAYLGDNRNLPVFTQAVRKALLAEERS